MNKFLNFDLFLREKKKETMAVVIYGKTYRVAMEIPAIVPVMLARAEEEMDEAQGNLLLIQALDRMLGRENVDELCEKGMSAKELSALAQKLFRAVTQEETDGGDAQELTDEDSRKPAGGGKKPKK